MTIKATPQKGHFSILFLLVIILLLSGVIIFLFLRNNASKIELLEEQVPVTKITPIDTSSWLIFPKKGSYTGWTIKHPAQNTPQGVEAENRITINIEDAEAVRISIRNGKYEDGTLKGLVEASQDYSGCVSNKDLVSTLVNGYDGYKFTSTCENYTKTTLTIVNPYVANNYITVKIFTYKIAQQKQKDLTQKILDTLTFLKPEPLINDGLTGIYDVNVGFSVRYPANFKPVTNEAWENASIILYSGGQSYDLVIQVWDNEEEYKNYYGNSAVLQNMTVHKVGSKYVTLLNQNNTEEVAKIIESFKVDEN
jgi:hypothetical protein